MGEPLPTPAEPARPGSLPCGEPGCPERVSYQRLELPGIAYDRLAPSGQPPTKRVYLECPAGHVRAYDLPYQPTHE